MNRLLASVLLLAWVVPAPAMAGDAAVDIQIERIRRFAKEPFEQRERSSAVRALGRIGGPEAAAALVPLFDDPFVHLRDHAVSAWIAMVKGDRASETLDWLATRGTTHRDPEVRAGVAVALGFAADAAAETVVVERLRKERDADVLVALLGALGRLGVRGDHANPADLLKHKDGRVALATADAFLALEAAETIPPTVRAGCLAHRDPLVRAAGVLLAHAAGDRIPSEQLLGPGRADEPRIALAEILRRDSPSLPWSEGRTLLASLLEQDSWRVRAAAVATALHLWRADVVPLLIERLAVEKGRLRLDLADALTTLTGKDLGTDAQLWTAWWLTAGRDFDPGARPEGRLPHRAPEDGEPTTSTVSFFRVPVHGERVAFLLDCSGSMRDTARGEGADGPSKLQVARDELARTLDGLDKSVMFDVFLYRYPSEFPPRAEMTRALGRLKPCDAAQAKKAKAWLSRQEAKGWGAFSDALALLLEEDVDTLYFLSDGRPSRGRFDRDFRLIAELEKANRFRQVVVHTVLAGREKADRAFLEDLARATGGRFSDATKDSGRD